MTHSPPEESGPRLRDVRDQAIANEDAHVEYVAFTGENGSISRMAIVRRRLARVLGRYLLGEPIAAGGMATVHLGRLLGPAGFSRTVAVKRLHAHLAADPDFVQGFVDEARIASRVRHTNVVQTLDVVAIEDELLLVLDYIHGESFARLRRLASQAGSAIPPNVASAIVVGVLRGLHAAHEAKSAKGTPLALVHRDVSPQNIIVGADGIARVLDFGVAKATGRVRETITKDIKGKLSYMPPEQLAGDELDRRSDLFAAGVVLWEALAGERLFRGDDATATMEAIYHREAPRLAERGFGVSFKVDDLLARALSKDASGRFDTADSMARALESALPPASDREVAEWVEAIAGSVLTERADRVSAFEGDDTGGSRARLFAAEPSGDAMPRRDALMPPPLERPDADPLTAAVRESVTNEHDTMRRRSHTMPTLELETAAAAAAIGLVVSKTAVCAGNVSQTVTAATLEAAHGPPGSIALEGVSEQRPLYTPLVMIAPSETQALIARVRESGVTRIDPIELRPRARTPIPMPMTPPQPNAKAKRKASVFQLALLVLVPPVIVAVALTELRPIRQSTAAAGGRVAPNALTAPTVAMASTIMTAPAVATPVTPPAPVDSATPPSKSDKSDKNSKKGHPPRHPPPPGPRIAVPVSR